MNAVPPIELNTQPIVVPPPAPVADKPKVNWLGVLADALAGAAGQPAHYAQSLERRKQEQSAFERGEQQYQRRRADELADDDRRFERDRQKPYRWEANDGSLMEIGPDGLARQVFKDPTPKMQSVQGFDEHGNPVIRFITPPPLAPAQPRTFNTLPQGAVPIGGQSQAATGGFRW